MSTSWRLRKELKLDNHDISIEKLFRGKLFSTFIISGPFGMVSIPLGFWVQKMTKNAVMGFIVTALLIMVITSVAYQIIWLMDNHRLYKNKKGLWAKFMSLQQDLWPVHWTGIRTGFVLGAFATLGLGGLLAAAVDRWFPALRETVPIGLLVFIGDVILVQGTFLRVMGDFFDRHSHVLAEKYRPALTSG